MKRTAETKLQQWKKNPGRKPLLLKGVRQSGKTYLLKHLFADSFPNSHYIDLKMNKVANSIFSSGNLDPQYILQEKYHPKLSIKLGDWNFSATEKVLNLPLYAAFKIKDLI